MMQRKRIQNGNNISSEIVTTDPTAPEGAFLFSYLAYKLLKKTATVGAI